jgi:hypothetical protein
VTGPFAALDLAAAAVLAPMLAVALYNLWTAARLEDAPPPSRLPRVSLLIPARDEAENLRGVLPHVARLHYPALEVLVLDDGSTDGTAEVVRAHARHDPRLRLLRGAEPPPGWLGKNRACDRLAAAASGEVLVFCDADVVPAPEAVARTVALLERAGADVLTALPRQHFGSWVERAVVPLAVHLPPLALLPLRLVSRTRAPSLSMANGQWLAFTRAAYDRCGGHAAVRGEVVEDVALGRHAKAAGLRLLPATAAGTLAVRMYRGGRAVTDGFTKNLYPLAGGRPLPFAAALAVFLLSAVYPWAALATGRAGAILPLLLLAGVRAAAAARLGHGVRSVLLHPAGALLLAAIALRSAAAHHQGTVRWKARTVIRRGAVARAGPPSPAGVEGRRTAAPPRRTT